MKVKFLVLVILLSVSFSICIAQSFIGKIPIRKAMIASNKGKLLMYTENDGKKIVSYLGLLPTKSRLSYKIVTFTWIWGRSHRATNRILIYTKDNKYLGNYYVTTTDDLPSYMQDNKLIFSVGGQTCVLKPNFDNGPPKTLYNECTKSDYQFDQD